MNKRTNDFTTAANKRTLFFIRHGHYRETAMTHGGILTGLGKEQCGTLAGVLGKQHVTAIYSSQLNRAMETAVLSTNRNSQLPLQTLEFLNEISPKYRGFDRTINSVQKQQLGLLHKRSTPEIQLTKIENFFFQPSDNPGVEFIFCHGNIIRALHCRSRKIAFGQWSKFMVHHCSITIFSVSPDGITIPAYGLTDHLAPALLSGIPTKENRLPWHS